MKKKFIPLFCATFALISCGNQTSVDSTSTPVPPESGTNFSPAVTYKELNKDEYINKTLAGLLGQFAGFLSGYEFASSTNPTGLPESWFDFINGPCAGNYTHFTPPDPDRYCRLRTNQETGLTEVWSDDDFHLDIFNQYVMSEQGLSSYGIKETWKKYRVSDWGGGQDAMMLINSKDMLAPFTGTIETGNRYGWCTEAYIENETLGMNAPGMPNVATFLADKFATNVGYFDSVNWAKFYAAMYSIAYFETDIKVVMEKAKPALPTNSYPYKTYEKAFELYKQYPNDYKMAARGMADFRRNLYRIDNIQTDPNVNGGLAILSWLYGNNDYMQSAKYSSIMGFDGDCTAAIVCGAMGILKGFKPSNEEYKKLNDVLYHNGDGVYHNDVETSYQAKILGSDYPTNQKIDDIVDMYRQNFEKMLLTKGGEILETSYKIPTTDLIENHSFLFKNYDAEERDTSNFTAKNGKLTCETEIDNENSHTGFAYFKLQNTKKGQAYHTFDLVKGKEYRLTTYVKTSNQTQAFLFARTPGSMAYDTQITFANVSSIISKSMTFIATENKMEVGIALADSATADDYVIFDDFMLEEVNKKVISTIDQKLNIYSKKYMKILSKPEQVRPKQEVLLCIEYRQYSGMPMFPTLIRNGKTFGGITLSNTSKESTIGHDIVEIPYVFENDSDTIQLDFGESRVYIGKIEIRASTQYMFR